MSNGEVTQVGRYRVGDKVRALESIVDARDNGERITEDVIYTVVGFDDEGRLTLNTDKVVDIGWDESCFEPSTDPAPTVEYFYLVKSPVKGKSGAVSSSVPEEITEDILPEVLRQLQWCVSELAK